MAKRHSSLQILSRQHHHALALAVRLQQGSHALLSDGWTHALPEQRRRVLLFMREELKGHFAAEEVVLFPLVAPVSGQAGVKVRDLLGEHRQLESLGRLVADAEEADLADLLRRFGALLERHIRSEERDLFPLCERELPADALEHLGDQLEAFLEEERARHRRSFYASCRRVINAPTARLFAAVREFKRYPEWWPTAAASGGADSSRADILLQVGPLTLPLTVSHVGGDRGVEFLMVEGSGSVRWNIMDFRGGREVRLELDIDLSPAMISTSSPELQEQIAAALASVLDALERRVTGA